MKTRFPTVAITLTVVCAALTACSEDKVTDVQTVLLPFSAAMTQEVTTEPVWSGDADGTGSALITIHAVTGELCWDMSVSRILLPATASHIHKAAPGVRGGIVVGLSAPDATGVARGCNASVDRTLLLDIIENPELYYVNVHTTDFAPGAIRGQLPQ
jgi:hypothetical protein